VIYQVVASVAYIFLDTDVEYCILVLFARRLFRRECSFLSSVIIRTVFGRFLWHFY
jgi:hypothetical protein